MSLTRRRLIAVAAAVPAFLLVERGLRWVGDVVDGAIRAVRPAADGTSATRCALCGASDHAMLDPRCPAARRVI
jgi:hypothetical protein